MARPASIEVAGYYPAPPSVLPHFASLVAWPGGSARGVLLDPCAGEGEAICSLRSAWSAASTSSYWPGPSIVACELEGDRAAALREALIQHRDQHFHGDAFRLLPTTLPGAGQGATVLYLNPPYDHDAEFGRLEHRFLTRFTDHLAAGTGILLFLVPYRALTASAAYLASHYAEVRAWRLPRPEFDAFGQVLVGGRRRSEPLEAAASSERILAWASDPESLPVLPEACTEPYEVPTDTWYHLDYRLAEVDVTAAASAFEPWPEGETGGRFAVRELLGVRYPVALPPKPAHIALALAAGMFNGHQLEPDDPTRFPPLLAKGAYTREAVEIDRRVSESGTVSTTTVDRPRLTVTILRLDTSTFHTLAEGTEPAGGDDLTRWTAADLLIHYGHSMAALLRRQFPPLHDPSDPAHTLALPRLPRRPFTAQDHAIQAALKLLATGRNPFLVAEVGTGKTTMALYVAAALSPEHHTSTVGQLRRLGFDRPLPVVRRTLVLCPPHLLGSWRDQAEAVVPDATVQIVREPADLVTEADLYILSREGAKLGHGHEGVPDACPRCHAELPAEPAANASRRRRCQATPRRPADRLARLSIDLATLLAHALPTDDLVASLAPRRLRQHFEHNATTAVSLRRVEGFRDSVLHHLEHAVADDSDSYFGVLYPMLRLLQDVTAALGTCVSELADRLLQIADASPRPSASSAIRREACELRSAAERDETPAPPATPTRLLLEALETLSAAAHWHESPPCGEPLYQAVPPRRVPLAREILRRHRQRFDLLVLDEAHEFNNGKSAQSKAAQRLAGLPGVPTLVLTGSLMGGYATSLFALFHALSPAFRREFDRSQVSEFVARYGYRKIRWTTRAKESDTRRGAHTDREVTSRRVIGEAPGVHPLFLSRYLLDTAIPVHKDDLDQALPPLSEEPVPLPAPEPSSRASELLTEYRRLQDAVLDRIRADRNDPDRAGRLLGTLVELPSYLDRATDDLEEFAIRYPEALGGQTIATGRAFPRSWRTPKERWLLAEIRRRREAGERSLVFIRHTRTRLPRRLLRLVQTVAPGAVWLDTPKVPTARREAWIDRHVNDPQAPVLLVNPAAIATGLNNLVGFSTAIWYELDYSAFTYRQAIGRTHRIGQTRPVTIRIPYYPGTAQEIAFQLVGRKVSASLQVDGLDVRAALEAAGAGDGLPDGLDAALSLGRAVYRALRRAA